MRQYTGILQEIKFPFLVGRIRVPRFIIVGVVEFRFPFLVGRIRVYEPRR